MPQYTVYQYDLDTGHINATNTLTVDADHPYLQTPNFLSSEEPIKDAQENLIQSGWSFTLVDGKPSQDANGNYIASPPSPYIAPLTINDYIFVAMINKGEIDIKTINVDVLSNLNASLKAEGHPILQ